jgi:hypothetical protein
MGVSVTCGSVGNGKVVAADVGVEICAGWQAVTARRNMFIKQPSRSL